MWNIASGERRRWRSSRRDEALHCQLVHAAATFDFEAFALADENGELLAASTDSAEGNAISELLATFSPMLIEARRQTERSALAERWLTDELDHAGIGWEVEDLTVREFHVGQRCLNLIAVGGQEDLREVAIYRVIFGVRRIWALTASMGD